MELWIRSQDKEKLIKVNYLRIIENEEDKELPFYINAGYDFMAAYKSKERALEVLDEIQKILLPKAIMQQVKLDEYELKLIPEIYVYQMPKE